MIFLIVIIELKVFLNVRWDGLRISADLVRSSIRKAVHLQQADRRRDLPVDEVEQQQLAGRRIAEPADHCRRALLQAEGLGERRVAVEVNGTIVSRSRHGEHSLADGDTVEIVHALGGG